MNSSSNKKTKSESDRNLKRSVVKLSTEEVNTFLVVFAALMQQTPCPKIARKAYLGEMRKRLRANGVGFISSARAFPTLGLKLLGNDLSGFPVEGFAKQSGQIYPSFLAWFWQDLTRLSKIKRPNKADAVSARKILTVLSFSRMIRISSLKQLRTSMKNFIGRMESPTESENDKPFKFDPAKKLGFSSEIFRCSSGPLDFTCLSTKPSSLVGKIKIPMHLPCEISFSDGTEDP